jgi:hypothetical protein
VKDNAWLRLQEVELGYTIPLKTKAIKNFRVCVTGYNLLTLSTLLAKYKMDPETANYGYPASQAVNLGLQISF